MNTRRILSNISFNSPTFFSMIVGELALDGLMDWCYWIVHKADNDDKKEHIHFCFQPSRQIDTLQFNKLFYQWDFIGIDSIEKYGVLDELSIDNWIPRKPTTRYQPVLSLDDWLLYCKHDNEYLEQKGLVRKHHYEWSEFSSTDYDSLEHDINNIDYTKISRLKILKEGAINYVPFYQLVQSGQLPIQFRAQYEKQYNEIVNHLRKRAQFEKAVKEHGFQLDMTDELQF